MAKQIIWSPTAKESLKTLLITSKEKHGNIQFSKSMYSLFQNALHRLNMNPFIGQPTEIENIRYTTPHPDYTIFYRHSLLKIEVILLWNNHYKLGNVVSIPTEKQKPDK